MRRPRDSRNVRVSRMLTDAGEISLPEQTASSGISLRGRAIPSYIAVEGPIGVGKTTLARRIADTFDHDLLLEEAELARGTAHAVQHQELYSQSTSSIQSANK